MPEHLKSLKKGSGVLRLQKNRGKNCKMGRGRGGGGKNFNHLPRVRGVQKRGGRPQLRFKSPRITQQIFSRNLQGWGMATEIRLKGRGAGEPSTEKGKKNAERG